MDVTPDGDDAAVAGPDPIAMLDQAGAALHSLVVVAGAMYSTCRAAGLPDALAHDMVLRWWEATLDSGAEMVHGQADE